MSASLRTRFAGCLPIEGSLVGELVCRKSTAPTDSTPLKLASFGSFWTPIRPTTSEKPFRDAVCAFSSSAFTRAAAASSVVTKTGTLAVDPASTFCWSAGASFSTAGPVLVTTRSGFLPLLDAAEVTEAAIVTTRASVAARANARYAVLFTICSLPLGSGRFDRPDARSQRLGTPD